MSSNFEVAIIDYGMGNLFSVLNACEKVGLNSIITADKQTILEAQSVILPGVGAFGDAMKALENLQLVDPILKIANSNKPLFGICLGMQLMMNESFEFGHRKGLGIFKGKVVRFENPKDENNKTLKVPEVQWNKVFPLKSKTAKAWEQTLLDGTPAGEYMYFIHSYYCIPESDDPVLSISRYGDVEYCSTLQKGNVFACQYHPERSGLAGLKFYKNLASMIKASSKG